MSNVKGDINHSNEFIGLINKLSQKYSSWKVFEDFLAMSAISISNAIDWVHREQREAEYLSIVERYTKEEIDMFPKMLAHIIEELEKHAEYPVDVLGKIFHELELHNKYKGQFFTPQHICDFMGMAALDEHDPDIEKKGYISLCEPCAGSGAMILGFAKAMKNNGYSFNTQMVVKATDIDIKCVHMCYLQLSLYGIPAVVVHGNTLSMQEWSRWYTPVYMIDGWAWRRISEDNQDKQQMNNEQTSEKHKFYFTFNLDNLTKESQLSLF